ncbi:hypothetical protein [Aestuariivivens sediminis]|uniref:hypothetical protein n=1 Tax=Aestuariivivens sediminis TaxID=2913557 RepID=UPI001F56F2FF|nr:hypothetical protein [Aestuariivivens sediminis]
MKNPLVKNAVVLNVVILIISGFISFIFLTIGIAHLIGGITQNIKGTSPDIPKGEAILGGIMVVLLCIIGFISLLLTIAAIQAIIKRKKTK